MVLHIGLLAQQSVVATSPPSSPSTPVSGRGSAWQQHLLKRRRSSADLLLSSPPPPQPQQPQPSSVSAAIAVAAASVAAGPSLLVDPGAGQEVAASCFATHFPVTCYARELVFTARLPDVFGGGGRGGDGDSSNSSSGTGLRLGLPFAPPTLASGGSIAGDARRPAGALGELLDAGRHTQQRGDCRNDVHVGGSGKASLDITLSNSPATTADGGPTGHGDDTATSAAAATVAASPTARAVPPHPTSPATNMSSPSSPHDTSGTDTELGRGSEEATAPPPNSPSAAAEDDQTERRVITFTRHPAGGSSTFSFTSLASPLHHQLALRPKRARPRSDVDGPLTATLSSKKRRLRLQLNTTSRLGLPFSEPPTHVLGREAVAGPGETKRFLKLAAFLAQRRQVAIVSAQRDQKAPETAGQRQGSGQHGETGRRDETTPAAGGLLARMARLPDAASAQSVLRRAAIYNRIRIRLQSPDEIAAAMSDESTSEVKEDARMLRATLLHHAGQQLAVGAKFFPSTAVGMGPPMVPVPGGADAVSPGRAGVAQRSEQYPPITGQRRHDGPYTVQATTASLAHQRPGSSSVRPPQYPAQARYDPHSPQQHKGPSYHVPQPAYRQPYRQHHHHHQSHATAASGSQSPFSAPSSASAPYMSHHHVSSHHHQQHHVALLPLARQAHARLSPSPPTSPSLRPTSDHLLPLPATPLLRPLTGGPVSSITATPRTTSGSESAASFWRPRASPPFTIPPRLQFGGRSQPGQGVDDEDEDDDRVDDDVAFPTSEHESRYEVEDSEEEDDDGDDEDEGGDGGDASTMQTATAGDKNAAASTSTAGTRKRKRRRRRAADGDDDVYSDFGLIFGTGRGGPAGGDRSGTGEELDLDVDAAVGAGTAEHFYEGYLDELDGIWARV